MSSKLAVQALDMAASVRRAAKIDGTVPLCIYDLIGDRYGEEIDLRFQPLKSLEGMYNRGQDGTGVIIVSSDRPSGRRRYTCAHELGHHLFGHQVSLDQLEEEHRDGHDDEREFLVDLFAGLLLMPKLAVLRAARERGIEMRNPSAEDIYALAGYFGVGYTTLLTHASKNIQILPVATADKLKRTSPQQIKQKVIGTKVPGDLLIVDRAWGPFRPIDAVVGDYILLPENATIEGAVADRMTIKSGGNVYQAARPGTGRAESPDGWSAYLRVERSRYCGMREFRNLEECDDE